MYKLTGKCLSGLPRTKQPTTQNFVPKYLTWTPSIFYTHHNVSVTYLRNGSFPAKGVYGQFWSFDLHLQSCNKAFPFTAIAACFVSNLGVTMLWNWIETNWWISEVLWLRQCMKAVTEPGLNRPSNSWSCSSYVKSVTQAGNFCVIVHNSATNCLCLWWAECVAEVDWKEFVNLSAAGYLSQGRNLNSHSIVQLTRHAWTKIGRSSASPASYLADKVA